jgi:hypothetical protein
MMDFFRDHKPLWAALGVWAAAMSAAMIASVAQTGGFLIYGLDDAYIHLAIAKHFLGAGVWGVTPYAFSSSSSSPIWPLLLAVGGKLFGALEILPLIINLFASTLLIVQAYVIARRLFGSGWQVVVFPLGMAFLLPAIPLAMIGMESLLFAAVALAFADAVVEYLLTPVGGKCWKVAVWGLALTSVRYEGLFLVGIACLLLMARRRVGDAIFVGMLALLPAISYAAVSLSLGWYALPNSLMIKHSPLVWNDPVSYWNMAARVFLPIADTLTVTIPRWNSLLYAAAAILIFRLAGGTRWPFWSRPVLALLLFTGTALVHGMWIAVEWQFRYEAYLIAIGIWAIAALLADARWTRPIGMQRMAALLLVIILGYAPIKGAIEGAFETPLASRNIFEQQVQMGRFLDRYYSGQAVVANDIGAIDYFADVRLVDAYGLASLPVAQAKQAGSWEQKRSAILQAQALYAGADVAVLYDSWFGNGADIPADWVREESWIINDNIVCGSDTVTWYATSDAAAKRLHERLHAFHAQLPPTVTVRDFFQP